MEIADEEVQENWRSASVHCGPDVCLALVFPSLSMVFNNIGLLSLLTATSAPIFSIIGWVVRSRQASSPDISYNDPEILLWAYVKPLFLYKTQAKRH